MRFLKQYVPRRNQPTRIEAKQAKPIRNVHPPNRTPKQNMMTNGKRDLTIAALFTQRPLRKIRVAKLTTFHLLCLLQDILFRLFATKEWQLQVKRLYDLCWNSCVPIRNASSQAISFSVSICSKQKSKREKDYHLKRSKNRSQRLKFNILTNCIE